MILDLNNENIDIIKNSFLKEDEVLKELECNPFARYLVLQEDNEIIGYIYYSDIYDRAEINQIEIKVSHRNCGKGKKLLKRMIELVDKSITLEVKIDNVPAICLYKGQGFVEKAIRKGYYQGIDGILMERRND